MIFLEGDGMEQRYIQGMKAKGYQQEFEKEPYIFIRRVETECYAVLLLDREISGEVLQRKRIQLEQVLVEQGCSGVNHLCIICKEDGMFSQELLTLVQETANVWLYARDQNRMYCYEHQPMEFDGLCQMFETLPKEKKGLAGLAPDKMPWVTLILIALNVLCFLIPVISGQHALWCDIGANRRNLVIGDKQFYRLFTSMFLHGDWEHLINNMLTLAVLGLYLEPVLGRVRYSVIYVLSGIGAGLASLWFQSGMAGSIGASGAIFGLSGALLALVLFWKGKIPGISVRRVVLMCVVSLYGGFTAVNVDNAAHIGGILAGFLLVIITSRFRVNST